MPENNINMGFTPQSTSGTNENRGCCNNGGGLFGNFGSGCDTEILFFIIIFLLLFTNFGCCR